MGGGDVAYSGPRAVESPDSEVKADAESDLSSTSHFSELCLLSPFRGQRACGQRAEAAALLGELPHGLRGAKKRGRTEKPSKTRAGGQSLGAAAALPGGGTVWFPTRTHPSKTTSAKCFFKRHHKALPRRDRPGPGLSEGPPPSPQRAVRGGQEGGS